MANGISAIVDPTLRPVWQTVFDVQAEAARRGLTTVAAFHLESGQIAVGLRSLASISQTTIDVVAAIKGVLSVTTWPIVVTENFDSVTPPALPLEWLAVLNGSGTIVETTVLNPKSGLNALKLFVPLPTGGSKQVLSAESSMAVPLRASGIDATIKYLKFSFSGRWASVAALGRRQGTTIICHSSKREELFFQKSGTDVDVYYESKFVATIIGGIVGVYHDFSVEVDLLGGRRRISVDAITPVVLSGFAAQPPENIPKEADLRFVVKLTEFHPNAEEVNFDDIQVTFDQVSAF